MQFARDAAIGVDIPTLAFSTTMATITTTIASATASATSSPSGPFHIDASQGECQLLGPFALVVQAALGGLAMLSLVYKRWREHPQRPVKVWFFDVSKQVFGSVLVHMSNIFMSMLTSGRFSIKVGPAVAERLMARGDDGYVPNPCSFYLLNLAIDTTVGIPILIVLLRVFSALASFTPFGKPAESIQSGYYGNPPNAWWWLKQSFIYFAGLFGMKVCVLVIFIMMPWISRVGDWALRWTEGNEKLQVAFVMMIFPLIMNALQYYIIDSFIKRKMPDHEILPSDDNDDDDDYERRRSSSERVSQEVDDETPVKINGRPHKNIDEEYDPEVDGDAPTIVGSSSNQPISKPNSKPSSVSVELLPKE
ncbi:vaculolar membrane [Trichoderma arundinaceum]|uniref:Vaculolar membrane n=1 Tax=Trichoderma arundinaceum TaxID=490622 RepID=A0A395NJP0_TRIAR|nr:vaculolar membrane [Trichoderma arundinaceum]